MLARRNVAKWRFEVKNISCRHCKWSKGYILICIPTKSARSLVVVFEELHAFEVRDPRGIRIDGASQWGDRSSVRVDLFCETARDRAILNGLIQERDVAGVPLDLLITDVNGFCVRRRFDLKRLDSFLEVDVGGVQRGEVLPEGCNIRGIRRDQAIVVNDCFAVSNLLFFKSLDTLDKGIIDVWSLFRENRLGNGPDSVSVNDITIDGRAPEPLAVLERVDNVLLVTGDLLLVTDELLQVADDLMMMMIWI